ncbi:MAG: 4Fe-4S binding protein [Eubacteriales bacterium]|jgi:2-oxoglutarate ferredoxin oxidoreductase subunit delta|nr:4Fe-4S binding protein [Bacillota bacterium]MDD7259864.1 4Fe-4S binding protein [Eubacteriales bacterium]
MSRKAQVNAAWCKSCGYCVEQCPRKALAIGDGLNAAGYRHVVIDEGKCIGCGVCYNVCPDYVFRIIDNEK